MHPKSGSSHGCEMATAGPGITSGHGSVQRQGGDHLFWWGLYIERKPFPEVPWQLFYPSHGPEPGQLPSLKSVGGKWNGNALWYRLDRTQQLVREWAQLTLGLRHWREWVRKMLVRTLRFFCSRCLLLAFSEDNLIHAFLPLLL